MTYQNACLTQIIYVATATLFSQDTHVGARIMACSSMLGPTWMTLVGVGATVRSQDWTVEGFSDLFHWLVIGGLLGWTESGDSAFIGADHLWI